MNSTSVSVIVPIRNEERYVENCLQSLLRQTYPSAFYEIIVLDGRSSDRSRHIVDGLCRELPHLYCTDNPAGTAPAAMNIGIRHAKGDIIIRADGHNVYPDDYIENCVKYLDQTGADNVGGSLLTVPAHNTLGARLVAAMLSNPFGVGDSRFRISSKEGFVETVPFGAFRREVFDRVGMYNEKLVRNQDNDLNARIRRAGGKIYQTSALQTTYHPVAGFLQLLEQTYRNSQWHVFSVRENAKSMGLRHFAPALFVLMYAVLIGGSPFSLVSAILLASLLVGYLLTGWYFAFSKSKSYGLDLRFLLPFACFCFHVSYGLGTLAGCRYLLTPPSAKPIRAGKEVSQDQTA
jgi:glycosyltransferase involved in cell wall biosynthesis